VANRKRKGMCWKKGSMEKRLKPTCLCPGKKEEVGKKEGDSWVAGKFVGKKGAIFVQKKIDLQKKRKKKLEQRQVGKGDIFNLFKKGHRKAGTLRFRMYQCFQGEIGFRKKTLGETGGLAPEGEKVE